MHHCCLDLLCVLSTIQCYIEHSYCSATRLLQLQGLQHPNPQQQFINDLIIQINSWCNAGKEVLLGMDANKDVDNPCLHISCLFMETGMIDLHYHCYLTNQKLATHQQGSSLMMHIIASTGLLADALTSAWILLFGILLLIKGDHCLLGLDFNPDILFGINPANPANGMVHGLNSNHKQHVRQHCKEVITKCNQHQIAEQIEAIHTKTTLTAEDLKELKTIDAMLTKILMKADQHVDPPSICPGPQLYKKHS